MRNILLQICVTLGLMVNAGASLRQMPKGLFNRQAKVVSKLANDSARVQQLQIYWNQLQAHREGVTKNLEMKTREATDSSAAYNAARNSVASAEAALFNAKASANTLYEKYITTMRDVDQLKSDLEKVERQIGSIANQLSKGMNSVATLQGKAESLVNQLTRDLSDEDIGQVAQPVQLGSQLGTASQSMNLAPNIASPYGPIPPSAPRVM